MKNYFKVIAMGRVGTLAINRFINDHPQISLPSFRDTKRIFKQKNGRFEELPFDITNKTQKKGVMIHDGVFFEKKYRKGLSNINSVKADSIIHLVRNPFDQVKSWINHINASASMGILGWQHIEPSVKSFYNNYKEHLKTVNVGLQCETFYKNHKEIKIIDFPSILSANIEQTMKDVYGVLGVDVEYKSDFLNQTQNNYTRELLSMGVAFELNNEVIEMGMAPVDLFFHHNKNAKPWVTIHDTEEIFKLCPTVPAFDGDLVFIPKNIPAYNNLSLKTKTMLHEDIGSIVREVMPVWAKSSEIIAQRIEENKMHTISDEDYYFLNELLKNDLEIFTRYHPEFKSLWNL